jgi:hypothetical protein
MLHRLLGTSRGRYRHLGSCLETVSLVRGVEREGEACLDE